MARRNEFYVDTSAFTAFLDQSDKHHPLFRRLFDDEPALITSALTVAEGHGWFLRKYNARRAAQFLTFVREVPDLAIEPFDDMAISEVTAIAATITKEHAVKLCWSTDRHLGSTGVPLATRDFVN